MSAALDLQRSNKRTALHVTWLATLVIGVGVALLITLVSSSDGDQEFWPFTWRVMVFTLPITAAIFGAVGFWIYSLADQRERRLRKQLGEPDPDRSPAARAGRSVGRVGLAIVMGALLTPVVLLPVRIVTSLVSLVGVPIEEIPQWLGLAAGAVTAGGVMIYSYRWLRSSPSSPLQMEAPTRA